MADLKATEEAPAVALTGTEGWAAVQNSGDVYLTANQVLDFIQGKLSVNLTDASAASGAKNYRFKNVGGVVTLQRLSDDGTSVLGAVFSVASDGTASFPKPPKITTASIDSYGVVDPTTAGADPTGTSLSDTAFQVSLDLLANKGVGGGLLVPAGTCRISTPKTYQSPMGIKMFGYGTSSRIRQEIPDGGKMFDFRPPAGVFLRGMVLEDFYIENASTNSRAFEFVSNRALYIRNIAGEVLSESYWWANAIRFIACLESKMEGGNWKNSLGGEANNKGVVRGNLFNFSSTVLNFVISKILCVGFDCAIFGDTAASPGLEGLSCVDCVFVAVNRGFDVRNQGDLYGGVNSQYGAPDSLRVLGGHTQAFVDCIRVRQGSCNAFQGTLLFKDLTFGDVGYHMFAGRQHNLQIDNVQSRVVGNSAQYTTQGAPALLCTSGDYVQLQHLSFFLAGTSGGSTPNHSISTGSATITDVISNGRDLTGNGFDVYSSNSILTAVRLV